MDCELRGAMAALAKCTDPEVLIEGRAGTAKTTGILSFILNRAQRYKGSRHLLVRQTRASLTDSVLVTMERLLQNGTEEMKAESYRVGREQRHAFYLFGSEIVCGGLDKPEKMFSTEWDTVYLAEATEVKTVEPWDLFGRAMRHNKTDRHMRIMDLNPGAPGHWINRRAMSCPDRIRDAWKTRDEYNNELQAYNHYGRPTDEHPLRRLVSVHPDNPAYWDLNAWDWTTFGRDYVFGTLAKMSGHRRARMFDGRWKAADNVVFPEFDELTHVVDPFPEVPEGFQVVVGVDPGYDHPTAILWFACDAKGGDVYIIDEVYAGGKSVREHGVGIRAKNQGRTVRRYYGDPQHAFSCTAQSPESIAMQYKRHCGITLTPWPRTGGNEETMVEAVRERLANRQLYVCRNCTNTIMEFQTWSYARDQKGAMKGGEDKFEDADNHAMDVVKGVIAAGFGKKATMIRATGGI